MRLPFVLCLSLFALPAHAVLSPCAYDAMVADASEVVQLGSLSLIEDRATDICQMQGTVIANFRGRFSEGQRLRFSVPCDIDRPPVLGPTIYHATDALDIAEFVEVHFDADGRIAGHGSGVIVLTAPTDDIAWHPVCD